MRSRASGGVISVSSVSVSGLERFSTWVVPSKQKALLKNQAAALNASTHVCKPRPARSGQALDGWALWRRDSHAGKCALHVYNRVSPSASSVYNPPEPPLLPRTDQGPRGPHLDTSTAAWP